MYLLIRHLPFRQAEKLKSPFPLPLASHQDLDVAISNSHGLPTRVTASYASDKWCGRLPRASQRPETGDLFTHHARTNWVWILILCKILHSNMLIWKNFLLSSTDEAPLPKYFYDLSILNQIVMLIDYNIKVHGIAVVDAYEKLPRQEIE